MNFSGCGWNVLPYYSTNGGSNWTAVSGIPSGDNDCTEEWSASKFLVADRVNGSKFYYYTYTGGTSKFYRSTNGGQTFSQVTGLSLPGNYKMKMEAVPAKEGNLFLCTANGSSLYKTIDGGTSWTTISSVTTAYRFGFGKPISPSTEPTIFLSGIVGGVNGIYYSTNLGSSWTRIWDGSVPAGCLDITGDMKEEYTVYMATSGRGVIYGTAQSSFVAVTGVSVTPTSASINVGSTQQLTATVAPSNATNKTVTWSSSNTSVATVNSSGLVTGVAAGTATITVTTQDGSKTATSAITVTAASSGCIGNLIVNPGFETGLTGWSDWGNFYTSTDAANGTGAAYVGTWSGGFYQNVNVTGGQTYTLKVYSKVTGSPTSAQFGFNFFNGATDLGVETSATVTATSYTLHTITLAAPANATSAQIWVWKENTFGGFFLDDFCFTAGTASIAVTGVAVTPTSVSINIGATQQLTSTVAPSNATNKTVTYSSSNNAVATVNASGLVTGVAAGSATITVTTQDGNKTATSAITVNTSTSKTINVSAKMMTGTSSTLELWLNNVSVKTWTISGSTYADYRYTISGSNNIKVYFPDNNSTDVQVDYIQIDGVFYQSENQAVNTSVWQGQCGGSYSEQMNCTGYIDFGTIDASGTGNTWVELSFDDFETGWGKWTSGGIDCSRYTGTTYAHQGSAALDIQDNSGAPSSFYLTNSINVTAYDQLKVSFWFYALSMESNEDFFLEYFNGTSWQIVATYVLGSGFANNSFQYKEVIIDKALYNFPANASLRFRCDASDNNDDIYIDEIRISGYNDTSKSMDIVTAFSQLTDKGKLQFDVYPNPVNSLDKTINIRTNQHFTGSVQLVDEAGRVVYRTSMDNDELSMNLGKLRPGFYIVQLSNGQKNYFSKIIVK